MVKLYRRFNCWFVLYKGEEYICGTLKVALEMCNKIHSGEWTSEV